VAGAAAIKPDPYLAVSPLGGRWIVDPEPAA
jgi:hypothetical protein